MSADQPRAGESGPGLTPDPTRGRDGDMGVSSERVGPTGPGQVARTGERDVTTAPDPQTRPEGEAEAGEEQEPEQDPTEQTEAEPAEQAEQSVGGREENPAGLPPKAGYPSADPRSADRPYRPYRP